MSKILIGTCVIVLSVVIAAERSAYGTLGSTTGGSDDWQTIHRQMGATGKNGYRPLSSRAYQSSARFHSRALHSYGTVVEQIPAETTREHLTQIQSSLVAVKKEIAKVDADTVSKAGVKEHIATINKHLTECETMCAMVEKSIAEGKGDNAGLCTHCNHIEEHLNAVRKEEDAMLKKLGIKLPDVPANHEEKEVKK